MTSTQAYARLRDLGVVAVSTADAAAAFGENAGTAHKTLSRLAAASLITPVRRSLWALGASVDPLLLPDLLTAPWPSYVSLQTALYHHGLIDQIPSFIYVVSLARPRRIATSVGVFSIHRVAPEFFDGFDVGSTGVKMATPEKALCDVLYLSATRDRQFAALPELELPRGFNRAAARAWADRITSPVLAAVVRRRLRALLERR